MGKTRHEDIARCKHHARFAPPLPSRNALKSTTRIIAEYSRGLVGSGGSGQRPMRSPDSNAIAPGNPRTLVNFPAGYVPRGKKDLSMMWRFRESSLLFS